MSYASRQHLNTTNGGSEDHGVKANTKVQRACKRALNVLEAL